MSIRWSRRGFLRAFSGGFLAYALGLRGLKMGAVAELGTPVEGSAYLLSIRSLGPGGWSEWAAVVPLSVEEVEGQALLIEAPDVVQVGRVDLYRSAIPGLAEPPLAIGGLHASTVYQVRALRDGEAPLTYHYPGTPGNLDEPEPVSPLFGSVDYESPWPLPDGEGRSKS